MDENQNYENIQENTENDAPLTLDDALAAAREEVAGREETDTENAESAENGSFERGEEIAHRERETASGETVENTEALRETNVGEETRNTQPVNENPEITALRQQLAQQNQVIAQYQTQIEAQAKQMQAMSKSASEQNEANAAAVAEQLMTPPELDFNAIMYADEETQREATRKFVDDTVNYARESIMRELAPVVGEYKAREAEANKISIKDKFRNNSQFEGFAEREPWMEQILQKNPHLQALPLDKQYEVAYLITQGMDNIKSRNAPAPAPKSVDERLADIEKDPELMRALEARRVRNATQRSENTHPAFAASGGSSNVSLNVPSEPDTFETAKNQALSRILGRG